MLAVQPNWEETLHMPGLNVSWLRRWPAAFVAASFIVSACSGGPSTPGASAPAPTQKPPDQVLHDFEENEPPFLDPAMGTDGTSLLPIRQLFVGLVRFDKDLKVIPWAADRWDVSPDGKTYTFSIRGFQILHRTNDQEERFDRQHAVPGRHRRGQGPA
jgi:hypothetical protein